MKRGARDPSLVFLIQAGQAWVSIQKALSGIQDFLLHGDGQACHRLQPIALGCPERMGNPTTLTTGIANTLGDLGSSNVEFPKFYSRGVWGDFRWRGGWCDSVTSDECAFAQPGYKVFMTSKANDEDTGILRLELQRILPCIDEKWPFFAAA